jgi:hypothetical protein
MPTRPMRDDPASEHDEGQVRRQADTQREDEERRTPVRDDEHDGGFGDGPLF